MVVSSTYQESFLIMRVLKILDLFIMMVSLIMRGEFFLSMIRVPL